LNKLDPTVSYLGKEKVLMVFIVKYTFSQAVSALQNIIMAVASRKSHLCKAGEVRIRTS
jgi:hypothetical protein